MLKPPVPCMKPPRAIRGVPELTENKRVHIAAALNDALQVLNSGKRTLQSLSEQHKGSARRVSSVDRTTAELARISFRPLIAPPIASLGPYLLRRPSSSRHRMPQKKLSRWKP